MGQEAGVLAQFTSVAAAATALPPPHACLPVHMAVYYSLFPREPETLETAVRFWVGEWNPTNLDGCK